ncbi:hypothetical protein FKW77_001919 [Venturia effusa]|uniref:Uncharacterized protein n=1 Tax=Venturia effusa TaxID=50376 RepID=A0A517L0T9_9PEZI|nr:hypothetical protein FKW77_001919 [Venturia effusa]
MAPTASKRVTRGEARAEKAREEAAAAALAGPADGGDEAELEEEVAQEPSNKRKRPTAAKKASAPKPKALAGRKKANTRTKKPAPVEEPEDEQVAAEEDSEEEAPQQPAKKQKKTPAAKAAAVKPARAAAPKRRARGANKNTAETVHEDGTDDNGDVMDVDDDQDMVDAPPPAWATGLQTNLIGAFTTLTGRFQTMTGRYDTDIGTLGTRFDEMDVKFDEQTTAITADFDTKLEGHADSINATFDTKFGELSGQVQSVAEKLEETEEVLRQHSNDIAGTNKRVDSLAKEVARINTKLKQLSEGNMYHKETSDALYNLDKRTKSEFKTSRGQLDELKSMVRTIADRISLLYPPANEEHHDDSDFDHDSDRGEYTDDDDEDGDSDSNDDTGNGGGGAMEAEPGRRERSETQQEDSEGEYQDVLMDSAEKQLYTESRAARMTAFSQSAPPPPTPRPIINRLEYNGDEVDYGNTTLEIETPTGQHRNEQGATAAPDQVQAGQAKPVKRKRVTRKLRPSLLGADTTQDITFSGAPDFNPALPNFHPGQASNVLPARSNLNHQAPNLRFEGDDTEFNPNELSGVSTPLHTPEARQNRRSIATSGSGKRLFTPSTKKGANGNLLRQSVKRSARMKLAAQVEDATDVSVAPAPSPVPASNDGFSDLNASFDVTAYVNDASSPLVARESPRSFVEEQQEVEHEEDAEDGNGSILHYGDLPGGTQDHDAPRDGDGDADDEVTGESDVDGPEADEGGVDGPDAGSSDVEREEDADSSGDSGPEEDAGDFGSPDASALNYTP